MKISKDIRDYVKVYENVFTNEFCKETINSLDAANWHDHFFVTSDVYAQKKYDNDIKVTWEITEHTKEITENLWASIEQYIVKDFSDFAPWFSNWAGYTSARINRYDKDTTMKLHCDHIQSMFDGSRRGIPILSIVGSLNNDYEGGEFVMWEDQVIDIPVGGLIIFPSNFMYPHRVNPIKSGVRYSYVSWVW